MPLPVHHGAPPLTDLPPWLCWSRNRPSPHDLQSWCTAVDRSTTTLSDEQVDTEGGEGPKVRRRRREKKHWNISTFRAKKETLEESENGEGGGGWRSTT